MVTKGDGLASVMWWCKLVQKLVLISFDLC